MPVQKNGQGQIVYSEHASRRLQEQTGVVADEDFAISDTQNVLKQIKFDIIPTSVTEGTLTLQAEIGSDATIDLTNLSSSNSFATIQPDSGTSPVAESSTDTLIFAGGTNISTSGNSTTDTVTINLDVDQDINMNGAGITNCDSLSNEQAAGAIEIRANGNLLIQGDAAASGLSVDATKVSVWSDSIVELDGPTVRVNSNRIQEVATPEASTDATNRAYVDGRSFDPATEQVPVIDDFHPQPGETGIHGPERWGVSNAGTGSGRLYVASEASHPGIVECSTGGTTTGRFAFFRTNSNSVIFGSGEHKLKHCLVRLSGLFDATDQGVVRLGYADAVGTSEAADGAYVLYSNGLYGDYWACVTASNASRTITALDGTLGNPTKTVAANTWYNWRITVNSDATSVTFELSVNGAAWETVATHTTNIASGTGRESTECMAIAKSAGTSERKLQIDLWHSTHTFATARATS